jgi:hypothetical protein
MAYTYNITIKDDKMKTITFNANRVITIKEGDKVINEIAPLEEGYHMHTFILSFDNERKMSNEEYDASVERYLDTFVR